MNRRWPYGPLRIALGKPTKTGSAQRIGVTERTIYRWDQHGLSHFAADRAAIAAGLHPAIVWTNWDTHHEQCHPS